MCGRRKCDYVQGKALHLDLYKRPFTFNLPDGASMYRTFIGSVLSIATIILITCYAYLKLVKL